MRDELGSEIAYVLLRVLKNICCKIHKPVAINTSVNLKSVVRISHSNDHIKLFEEFDYHIFILEYLLPIVVLSFFFFYIHISSPKIILKKKSLQEKEIILII